MVTWYGKWFSEHHGSRFSFLTWRDSEEIPLMVAEHYIPSTYTYWIEGEEENTCKLTVILFIWIFRGNSILKRGQNYT
jgi:hypothetical protein